MIIGIVERCNALAVVWSQRMGSSLIDAAVVLAVVSLLWFFIRKKASPQFGYALFLLVPLKLFFPLEVSIPEQLVAWAPRAFTAWQTEPTPPIVSNRLEPTMPAFDRSPLTMPTDRSNVVAAPRPIVERAPSLSLYSWLALTWASGVFLLTARLIVAQIRFRHGVVRSARPTDLDSFPIDFTRLLRHIGVRRKLRVVESELVTSPAVWGIFRPTLILPAGIARSLPVEQLEWVLLHELAHVRRHDLAVNCFQRLAVILHFANPAVWIANRMINRLREYACDDVASSLVAGSQTASGEAFLGVMRFAASAGREAAAHPGGALGMFESSARSSCLRRMARLLDEERRLTVKLGLGSLCALLLIAAVALPQLRAADPKKEKATAVIKDEKGAKPVVESHKDEAYEFNVVIAKHVMLLEGKRIVTWKEIEEIIAKRSNPSQTHPHFYFTNSAFANGIYEPAKKEIWRICNHYKTIGHSEGSLSPQIGLVYDRIRTADDQKLDESLRAEGYVVNDKGEPVRDAEIILITPADSAAPVDWQVPLVEGRLRNPLDFVLTRSDAEGLFSVYPPKNANYRVIALHPNAGINSVERDQLLSDRKLTLLRWASLTVDLKDKNKSNQEEPSLRSTLLSAAGLPEITFSQYWSDLKKKESRPPFVFSHVPPVWNASISRAFEIANVGRIDVQDVSVSLAPNEKRSLLLDPLTEQQKQYPEELRRFTETNSKNDRGTDQNNRPKEKPRLENKTNGSERLFEVTVVGPDKKPVKATAEIQNVAVNAGSVRRGELAGESKYGRLVTTEDDGRFTMAIPQNAKRLWLTIHMPGYAPFWAAWNDEGNERKPIPENILVELKQAWSVGGVVVDEQGTPIANATVHPSVQYQTLPGVNDQLYVGKEVTTDQDGRWRYDLVPASKKDVYVEVNHPNYQPSRPTLTRSVFGLSGNAQPTAPIVIKAGLTIVGAVTNESGEPIKDALVRTKLHNNLREARTDAEGKYRLVGCEEAMTRVVASAKGKALDMRIVSVEPKMEPVNFVMRPGGKIRIHVVDEIGNPVAKTRVFPQAWRGEQVEYFEFDDVNMFTDRNGVWEWNEAPLDEFKADIYPPAGAAIRRFPLVARAETYEIVAGAPLRISGSVIDEATREPVKSFRAIVGGWDGGPGIFWERNDSYAAKDGTYSLKANNRQAFFVKIEADGYQVATSRKIESSEGSVKIDFELKPKASMTAKVLTPDGKPAGGAELAVGLSASQIILENGEILRQSTDAPVYKTDGEGRFSFPGQDGPFRLIVTHPTGYYFAKSATSEVPAEIKLSPWAKVEGVYRVASKPIADARIAVQVNGYDVFGRDEPRILTSYTVNSKADGHFQFDRVFPGSARVGRDIMLIANQGAAEVASAIRVPVHLTAGETTRLDLGGEGRAAVGRLVAPPETKEKPLWKFAQIEVRPFGAASDEGAESSSTKRPSFFITADLDGTFRIDDMPPGEYELEVSFSEHRIGFLKAYRVTVPKGNGAPIDLGEIQLKRDVNAFEETRESQAEKATTNEKAIEERQSELRILTPGGKPADGAKAAVAIPSRQIMIANGEFADNVTNAAVYATPVPHAERIAADKRGTLRIPKQTEPFQLIVLHAEGFSLIKPVNNELPSEIRLKPWATIEGAVRAGTKPVENTLIRLGYVLGGPFGENGRVSGVLYETKTQADGSYRIEKALPGAAMIGYGWDLPGQAKGVISSVRFPITIKEGERRRFDVGGSGRAVAGKLVPAKEDEKRIRWGETTLHVNLPTPEDPPIPTEIKNDEKKVAEWLAVWEKTEAGKAYKAETAAYTKRFLESPAFRTSVNDDGSFRIDDMPPGDYGMIISLAVPGGYRNEYRRFTVPTSEEPNAPFELGEMKLKSIDLQKSTEKSQEPLNLSTEKSQLDVRVLTPDGRPAAGAQTVVVSGEKQELAFEVANGSISARQSNVKIPKTNSEGRISLPLPTKSDRIVVTHPSGYGFLKSTDLAEPSAKLTLMPWSSVEGTVRIGKKTQANSLVTLNYAGVGPFDEKDVISFAGAATSDSDGKYKIEQAFPGKGHIGSTILAVGKPSILALYPIVVNENEKKTFDVGGSGRTIVAKFIPPSDLNVEGMHATLLPQLPLLGDMSVPDDVKNDPLKIEKWKNDWERSEAGRQYQKKAAAYKESLPSKAFFQNSADADGTLRFADVPPGDYSMFLTIAAGAKSTIKYYRFTVPQAGAGKEDEPVDLGTVLLEGEGADVRANSDASGGAPLPMSKP